jgi:hypothetical protein
VKFPRWVDLYAPGGKFVRAVHGELAERMLRDREARLLRKRRREVRAIEAVETTGFERMQPATALTVTSYLPESYTFDGLAGTEFKDLDARDRWSFVLALTECMVLA